MRRKVFCVGLNVSKTGVEAVNIQIQSVVNCEACYVFLSMNHLLMTRFNLALRLLWRDSRSGELTILLLALIIAVTSSTAIALFSDRLQRTMTTQTAEFLAADLVVSSPTTIPDAWTAKATQLHLAQARTAEFSSVLIENDELLLASIKAVSAAYPLRGFLKTTSADYSAETITHNGPEKGTVWLEKRILPALKLRLGDPITVGEKQLTISKIITYEPDKQSNFYSFSPRVMINEGDLQATGIVQPGSHIHYFFQFTGEANTLNEFKHWLKPQLNPSQRIMDIHEDRPELGSALERAERYLGLSSIVVILMPPLYCVAWALNKTKFSGCIVASLS
jgi:putative ABC transport system permease protein